MTVRTSMADIIDRVQDMINDASATIHTEQHIQDVLDRNRVLVRYYRLIEIPTYSSTVISYLDYTAEELTILPWESDAIIVDGQYNTVSPTTSDYNIGYWTFATSKVPPLFINGKYYNVFVASAILLEEWASKLKLQYDFGADDQRYTIEQQYLHCLELAKVYRSQSPVLIAKMIREDIANYDGIYSNC